MYMNVFHFFQCCVFLFTLSVGGGESLYGLPVLCTRVLSILRGKCISGLWCIVFFMYLVVFLYCHTCLVICCFCLFFVPVWHQGAGILHHLPVGDPLRLLCVTVSGGKCASVHHATRR